jgi:hypothetical protein
MVKTHVKIYSLKHRKPDGQITPNQKKMTKPFLADLEVGP